MARRPKKQIHEEHADETWLIPYADLLTLLLALFIVLFASSQIDAKKFDQIVQSFNVALSGGVGVLNQPSAIPVSPDTVTQSKTRAKSEGKEIKQSEKNAEKSEEQKKFEAAYQKETEDLKKLQAQVNDYIASSKLQDKLQTELTGEGLLITILDNALFASGSAEVRPEARKMAETIANLLVPQPKLTTVTGHTDNVPIHTRQFPSNWDLSGQRATNFLRILLENKNLDPAKFSATAKGEYHPVASNDTPEGRAKNRRVEVMVMRSVSTK